MANINIRKGEKVLRVYNGNKLVYGAQINAKQLVYEIEITDSKAIRLINPLSHPRNSWERINQNVSIDWGDGGKTRWYARKLNTGRFNRDSEFYLAHEYKNANPGDKFTISIRCKQPLTPIYCKVLRIWGTFPQDNYRTLATSDLTSSEVGLFGDSELVDYPEHKYLNGHRKTITYLGPDLLDDWLNESMKNMFYGFDKLIGLEEGFFDNILSQVKTYESCFECCYALEYVPDLLLGLSNSKVESTARMFKDCYQLNRQIALQNASALKTISYMYANCISLIEPNAQFGNNFPNLIDGSYVYYGAEKLVTIPQEFLASSVNIKTLRCAFYDTGLYSTDLIMSHMGKLNDLVGMYAMCKELVTISPYLMYGVGKDLDYTTPSNRIDVSYMFYEVSHSNQDLGITIPSTMFINGTNNPLCYAQDVIRVFSHSIISGVIPDNLFSGYQVNKIDYWFSGCKNTDSEMEFGNVFENTKFYSAVGLLAKMVSPIGYIKDKFISKDSGAKIFSYMFSESNIYMNFNYQEFTQITDATNFSFMFYKSNYLYNKHSFDWISRPYNSTEINCESMFADSNIKVYQPFFFLRDEGVSYQINVTNMFANNPQSVPFSYMFFPEVTTLIGESTNPNPIPRALILRAHISDIVEAGEQPYSIKLKALDATTATIDWGDGNRRGYMLSTNEVLTYTYTRTRDVNIQIFADKAIIPISGNVLELDGEYPYMSLENYVDTDVLLPIKNVKYIGELVFRIASSYKTVRLMELNNCYLHPWAFRYMWRNTQLAPKGTSPVIQFLNTSEVSRRSNIRTLPNSLIYPFFRKLNDPANRLFANVEMIPDNLFTAPFGDEYKSGDAFGPEFSNLENFFGFTIRGEDGTEIENTYARYANKYHLNSQNIIENLKPIYDNGGLNNLLGENIQMKHLNDPILNHHNITLDESLIFIIRRPTIEGYTGVTLELLEDIGTRSIGEVTVDIYTSDVDVKNYLNKTTITQNITSIQQLESMLNSVDCQMGQYVMIEVKSSVPIWIKEYQLIEELHGVIPECILTKKFGEIAPNLRRLSSTLLFRLQNTSFRELFRNTAIEYIPENIFVNNMNKVRDFSYCFADCPHLFKVGDYLIHSTGRDLDCTGMFANSLNINYIRKPICDSATGRIITTDMFVGITSNICDGEHLFDHIYNKGNSGIKSTTYILSNPRDIYVIDHNMLQSSSYNTDNLYKYTYLINISILSSFSHFQNASEVRRLVFKYGSTAISYLKHSKLLPSINKDTLRLEIDDLVECTKYLPFLSVIDFTGMYLGRVIQNGTSVEIDVQIPEDLFKYNQRLGILKEVFAYIDADMPVKDSSNTLSYGFLFHNTRIRQFIYTFKESHIVNGNLNLSNMFLNKETLDNVNGMFYGLDDKQTDYSYRLVLPQNVVPTCLTYAFAGKVDPVDEALIKPGLDVNVYPFVNYDSYQYIDYIGNKYLLNTKGLCRENQMLSSLDSRFKDIILKYSGFTKLDGTRVIRLDSQFERCFKLTTIQNDLLSNVGYDTSLPVELKNTFAESGITMLPTVNHILNLSRMDYTFYKCSGLTGIPKFYIKSNYSSDTVYLYYTFANCMNMAITEQIVDTSSTAHFNVAYSLLDVTSIMGGDSMIFAGVNYDTAYENRSRVSEYDVIHSFGQRIRLKSNTDRTVVLTSAAVLVGTVPTGMLILNFGSGQPDATRIISGRAVTTEDLTYTYPVPGTYDIYTTSEDTLVFLNTDSISSKVDTIEILLSFKHVNISFFLTNRLYQIFGTQVEKIPDDLWHYCDGTSTLTQYQGMFRYFTKLKNIPAGVLDVFTSMEDLSYFIADSYDDNTELTIASTLFDKCPLNNSGASNMFASSNLKTLPAIFKPLHSNIINITDMCRECYKLTSVDMNLLTLLTLLKYAKGLFQNCISLTIDDTWKDFFKFNTNLVLLASAFKGVKIHSLPSMLSPITNLQDITDIFGATTGTKPIGNTTYNDTTDPDTLPTMLDDNDWIIPDGFLDNKTFLMYADGAFAGRLSLRGYPESLLDNAPGLETAYHMFCNTKIKMIHDNTFKTNSNQLVRLEYFFANTKVRTVSKPFASTYNPNIGSKGMLKTCSGLPTEVEIFAGKTTTPADIQSMYTQSFGDFIMKTKFNQPNTTVTLTTKPEFVDFPIEDIYVAINWGDGTPVIEHESITINSITELETLFTHTYTGATECDITVTIPALVFPKTNPDISVISLDGSLGYTKTNFIPSFADTSRYSQLSGNNYGIFPDVVEILNAKFLANNMHVTSLRGMFANHINIAHIRKNIFEDLVNVIDLSFIMAGTTNLFAWDDLDSGNQWSFSSMLKIQTLAYAFSDSNIRLTIQSNQVSPLLPLQPLDNLKDISYMFRKCPNVIWTLDNTFNHFINVEKATGMYQNCVNLTNDGNKALTLPYVKDISYMFENTNLSQFNNNSFQFVGIDSETSSGVQLNMQGMFKGTPITVMTMMRILSSLEILNRTLSSVMGVNLYMNEMFMNTNPSDSTTPFSISFTAGDNMILNLSTNKMFANACIGNVFSISYSTTGNGGVNWGEYQFQDMFINCCADSSKTQLTEVFTGWPSRYTEELFAWSKLGIASNSFIQFTYNSNDSNEPTNVELSFDDEASIQLDTPTSKFGYV